MPGSTNGHPPIAAPLGDVTTERLALRRFHREDVDGLAAVFAKPEVWRYPFGRAFTRDETTTFVEAQILAWESCGFGCWVAIQWSSGRIVGYVGLSVPTFLPEILPAVEVGWRFDPAVWGQGYATECGTAGLDAAFTTLGLSEVCSVPQSDNPASVRVAQRLGMRFDRDVVVQGNDRRGAVGASLFVMTRDEWLTQRTGPTSRPA